MDIYLWRLEIQGQVDGRFGSWWEPPSFAVCTHIPSLVGGRAQDGAGVGAALWRLLLKGA